MTPIERAKDFFTAAPKYRTAERLAEIIQEAIDDAIGKRRWRFDLHCPRCGKDSETVADHEAPAPQVNCGDCLMNDVTIVEMDVVAVHEVAA